MKTTILLLFTIIFSVGAFAQNPATAKAGNTSGVQMRDGFVMKKGKVIVIKNGQSTILEKDIALNNGTLVMADGSVKMKNGETRKLGEGDYISVSGATGKMKHGKMIEDKMATDSPK